MKSGTATIEAICENSIASCKITVKSSGGSSTESTLKLTNDGATNIKETTTRINANISPGMIVEEAGFYWGISKEKLVQVKESVNSYTTTIWYDLGTGKWTNALKPNTTYYYQIYVVINGTEYKSKLSKFTTASYKTEENSDKFSNLKASDITASSAKISTDYSKNTYMDAGIYFGTSPDIASMKKISEYAHGGSPSASYANSYKLGVAVYVLVKNLDCKFVENNLGDSIC